MVRGTAAEALPAEAPSSQVCQVTAEVIQHSRKSSRDLPAILQNDLLYFLFVVSVLFSDLCSFSILTVWFLFTVGLNFQSQFEIKQLKLIPILSVVSCVSGSVRTIQRNLWVLIL